MKWPMTWPMTRWMMKHRQILGVSIVVLLAGALGESAHNDFQYPWTAGKSYLASQGWNGIYMKGGTCISGGSRQTPTGQASTSTVSRLVGRLAFLERAVGRTAIRISTIRSIRGAMPGGA